MSVHFPDLDDSYEHYPKAWEPVGAKVFWASTIIAATAFVPALAKKKRVYTPFVPALAEQPLPPAQIEGEIPAVLQCTEVAKEKITRLWTQIADGYLSPDLWTLGNQIEEDHQVHPLALLIALPKEKLRKVFNSRDWLYTSARIPTILWGIKKGMRKAMREPLPFHWPNLWTLIPSFAAQMNKDERQIRQLIQADDWRAFVHYLYDIPG